MSPRRGTFLAGVLVSLLSNPLLATEYQELEDIAPESAEESAVPLGNVGKIRHRPRRRVLRNALAERSPFWQDSQLELNLRLYDFNRENGEEKLSEALAVGTELTFRSGQWQDRLATVVFWHTSSEIDAREDRPVTGKPKSAIPSVVRLVLPRA